MEPCAPAAGSSTQHGATLEHSKTSSSFAAGTLIVESYGVAFGERVILADIHFTLPSNGVTVLMGPAGTGKSTLLRSLAGLNASNPRFRSWGRVEYRGRVLARGNAPALVVQNAQVLGGSVFDYLADGIRSAHGSLAPASLRERVHDLLAQYDCLDLGGALASAVVDLPAADRRRVSIVREALLRPTVLMIDEPTTGLDEVECDRLLALVRCLGQTTSLLLVLHNQMQARSAGERILLLAGGRIQSDSPATEFFERPPNPVASGFVRTGNCALPSPDASPESLAEDAAPVPPLPIAAQVARSAEPEYRGPRGFKWIVPGKVGSSSLPGAVIDIDHDLAALRVVGVTLLITLTNSDLPKEALRRHGLRNLHLPIYDREAPSLGQMRMLAVLMSRFLRRGEVLGVHCRAGIGRTGTVLAGWLIAEGLTAEEALRRVRAIDPAFVQTQDQEDFLHRFEAHLLELVPPVPANPPEIKHER